MYEHVPTNELASEFLSSPLTPKSQSFTSPLVVMSMLPGLMSVLGRTVGKKNSLGFMGLKTFHKETYLMRDTLASHRRV